MSTVNVLVSDFLKDTQVEIETQTWVPIGSTLWEK